MSVDPESDGWVGVTEALGDHIQWLAARDEDRGVGVAEVVDAGARQRLAPSYARRG
jgi:hypothetical protein